MDWLGRATGRGPGPGGAKGGDGGEPATRTTAAAATTTSKKSTTPLLLATPPFFGRAAPTSTRREAPTTGEPGASASASSASASTTTNKAALFFTDIGESLRDSSASLGALLSNARDAVSLLPPPAPASTSPTAPASTPAPAAEAEASAVARAEARLAGLRLVVVQESAATGEQQQEEAGRPPFRIGPRTVVVAQAGDGRPLLAPTGSSPEEQGDEEEECSVVVEWFRSAATPGGGGGGGGGALTPIPGLGTNTTRYSPTADDVGACLAMRVTLLTPISLRSRSASLQDGQSQQREREQEPPFAVLAEAGPFAADEPTAARLRQHLAARTPLALKRLREPGGGDNAPHLTYDLVVGPAGVELWSRPAVLGEKAPAPAGKKGDNKKKKGKAPAAVVLPPRPAAPARQPLNKEREPWTSSLSSDDEDDDGDSSSSSSSSGSSDSDDDEGEEEEGRAELVGRGSYSRETLVALHPLNPAAVLVQLPLFLLPASPAAAPVEERTEAGLLVQRVLEIEGGERALLALLWRAWRKGALGEEEGEGTAVHDAVLLAGQLKEEEGQGQRPAIVTRVSSEAAGREGLGGLAGQEGEGALVRSCRLSDSNSNSSSEGGEADAGAEEEGGEEEAPGAALRRLQQEVSDAREQLALERQQQSQQQHLRRASSSSGAVGGGGGLGGFLSMRRGSGEERDRVETIKVLKRELETLHARVAELEAQLHAAEDAAVRWCLLLVLGDGGCLYIVSITHIHTHTQTQAEARDELAEAAGRAASLGEEAERLRVQEEALALQRASNEQALDLARGEMERLRAEAAGLREERVRGWVGWWDGMLVIDWQGRVACLICVLCMRMCKTGQGPFVLRGGGVGARGAAGGGGGGAHRAGTRAREGARGAGLGALGRAWVVPLISYINPLIDHSWCYYRYINRRTSSGARRRRSSRSWRRSARRSRWR